MPSRVSPNAVTVEPDRKQRWGGLLENPYLSIIQRNILDAGRMAGLCRACRDLEYDSLLDVGCGLGDGVKIAAGCYVGVDNSLPRLNFAARQFPQHRFVFADAGTLPFDKKSFDLVLLSDTAHHLDDASLARVLTAMRRVARRYLVIHDPIVPDKSNPARDFLYGLDRGSYFRTLSQWQAFFQAWQGRDQVPQIMSRSFPGIYVRATFVVTL